MFGQVVDNANMKDLEEMKASNVGLKMIRLEAEDKDRPLTEPFIRELHHTLLREDYEEQRVYPDGSVRTYIVHAGIYKTRPNSVITRYGDRFDYASPEETPALMADLVRWYNEQERKGEMHPVDLAILFHYRYIRIHPFEDGNGRIARLLVNYILLRHDYPMIAVRSRNKKYYLEALHRADLKVGQNPSEGASATLNQIKPFRDYFTQLIADEIAGYITFLTHQGDNIWWYDGAVVTFNSQTPATVLREMKYNPMIQPGELAEIAGVSRVAIVKTIKQLTEKGYIIQDENSKVERWHVIITDLSR
jgi:Fic family protein